MFRFYYNAYEFRDTVLSIVIPGVPNHSGLSHSSKKTYSHKGPIPNDSGHNVFTKILRREAIINDVLHSDPRNRLTVLLF